MANGVVRAAVRLVVVLGGLGDTPPVAADGGSAAADLRVAQSLGDRQLTVVLHRAGPGPLRVDVVLHSGPAGELVLTALRDGVDADRAVVALPDRPGTAGATLRVDRAGSWELGVADGARTALIPFVLTTPAPTSWERAAYGGWVAAGGSLLVALVVAVRARRWWTPLVPGAGVVVAATVAVTAALLSVSIPPPVEPGWLTDLTRDGAADPSAVPGDATSRPPVNVLVSAPGAVAGGPADVVLDLTDAATGRPVDDLLVHHDALVHLVVVGPSGRVWHLHPVRTDRGRYTAHLTPEAGRHAVAAEVARRGGGVQQVRSTLDVPGGGPAAGAGAPGVVGAPGTPGGCQQGHPAGTGCWQGHPALIPEAATVSVEPAPAGTPTVLAATFGDTATLQPWLGMPGHLLVSGPLPAEPGGGGGSGGGGSGVDSSAVDGSGAVGGEVGAAVASAPVWAHVHASTGLTADARGAAAPGLPAPDLSSPNLPAPDVTVAAFGPQVRFAFTFPHPGRYRLWFQAMRDHTVLTVPAVVDVPAPGPRGATGPPPLCSPSPLPPSAGC